MFFLPILADYGHLWSIIGNFGFFLLLFFGPIKCIFGNLLVNYMSLVTPRARVAQGSGLKPIIGPSPMPTVC